MSIAVPKFTPKASLAIYDIHGRQVDLLISGPLDAGYYSFTWDGAKHHAGLYILKYSAGDYTETRKMILLK
ncbi:MAG: T9SS type A sorting domain-containing protein [Fidelibacterota bacterium]